MVNQCLKRYNPKIYSDEKMAYMTNEAARIAIRNFGVNGANKQIVKVDGITFEVPIGNYQGQRYVPTAYPINPNRLK